MKSVGARELRSKHFSLIVVAEGVKLPAKDPATGAAIGWVGAGGGANPIADHLRALLHKEIRATVLVRVQRGSAPTPFGPILGTRLGVAATDLAAPQRFVASYA